MSVGYVHSLQSLGTVDGPGVRFVVFMQGCPLRCGCCHNPDTWSTEGGAAYTHTDIVDKVERYRNYFGEQGGITISGGEPLLQSDFVGDVFAECHLRGIHTCLDTSGCLLDKDVKAVLAQTDRVLLDWKFTTPEQYEEHVGCSMEPVETFLAYLNQNAIPTTLRQVIIPTINDDLDNVQRLKSIANTHPCVDKVELLPFRKICQVKYDTMGMAFPFGNLPEADTALMDKLNNELIV